jgi:hypothetical protein
VGVLLGGAQAAARHVMAVRLPATLAAVFAIALAAAGRRRALSRGRIDAL